MSYLFGPVWMDRHCKQWYMECLQVVVCAMLQDRIRWVGLGGHTDSLSMLSECLSQCFTLGIAQEWETKERKKAQEGMKWEWRWSGMAEPNVVSAWTHMQVWNEWNHNFWYFCDIKACCYQITRLPTEYTKLSLKDDFYFIRHLQEWVHFLLFLRKFIIFGIHSCETWKFFHI